MFGFDVKHFERAWPAVKKVRHRQNAATARACGVFECAWPWLAVGAKKKVAESNRNQQNAANVRVQRASVTCGYDWTQQ